MMTGQHHAVTHEDLADELTEGRGRIHALETGVEAINEKLTCISEKLSILPDMQKEIAATKEIVEAFGAVKTMGKFVKWIGGIATALVALWIVMKAVAKAVIL